jgi:hypothetical protein
MNSQKEKIRKVNWEPEVYKETLTKKTTKLMTVVKNRSKNLNEYKKSRRKIKQENTLVMSKLLKTRE